MHSHAGTKVSLWGADSAGSFETHIRRAKAQRRCELEAPVLREPWGCLGLREPAASHRVRGSGGGGGRALSVPSM